MNDLFVENTPEGRPPRSWDFFLTIFLIFMLLVLTAIYIVLALGFGVAALGCADSSEECTAAYVSIGSLIVLIGVPVVALVGIVLSVVWIARRKLSFWIPLVASLVTVGLYLLGSYVVGLGLPG